jgi:hypothetical protein
VDKWGRDEWEVKEERERALEERLWGSVGGEMQHDSEGKPRDLSGKIICSLLVSPFLYFSTAFIIDEFNSAKVPIIENVAFLVVPGFFLSTLLLIWLSKIPFIGKCLKFIAVGCFLVILYALAVYFF